MSSINGISDNNYFNFFYSLEDDTDQSREMPPPSPPGSPKGSYGLGMAFDGDFTESSSSSPDQELSSSSNEPIVLNDTGLQEAISQKPLSAPCTHVRYLSLPIVSHKAERDAHTKELKRQSRLRRKEKAKEKLQTLPEYRAKRNAQSREWRKRISADPVAKAEINRKRQEWRQRKKDELVKEAALREDFAAAKEPSKKRPKIEKD